MAALTKIPPTAEIEEDSLPFALAESCSETEQATLENLFSSPNSSTSSVGSALPPIGQTTASEAQSPLPQHKQDSLTTSNSGILETNRIPPNTLLTSTPTVAKISTLPTDASLLLSQQTHGGDAGSVTTNSTSSMNSSGSNASSSSGSQLPSLSDSEAQQHHKMQASSTIMASSLFTVPLNSDSTMSLQNSHVKAKGSMRFSQLMQTADDNLPAVPENEAMDSFEMFASETRGKEILPGTTEDPLQVPQYSPHSTSQSPKETNQWFFNLLSAARRSSQPRGQAQLGVTILDASASRLDTPLIAPQAPFLGGMDHARARVLTVLEDANAFEASTQFKSSGPQGACTVEDIMNIVSNPSNLQLWYDPVKTLVVTSRTSDSEDGGVLGGSGGSNGSSSDRQYEGEWIEASTTALESPPSVVSPLYDAESALRASLGVGNYGRITIFVEKIHSKVSLTVGPFPGGVHLRHTISVSEERNGAVKIVDRVKVETHTEDSSVFQSTLSLGGILNSCLLPPVASYMEQMKNSMAKLLMLVESGQVSRSGGRGMPPIL